MIGWMVALNLLSFIIIIIVVVLFCCFLFFGFFFQLQGMACPHPG